jgi:hypothetical protein
LKDLYIVNYCSEGCTPLKSITRMPEHEAYAMASELAASFQGTAFGRFADFENYYPRRIKAEKWLYDCFLEMGGRPQTRHPLYFVLHGSEYLDSWFGKGVVTRLDLSAVDEGHVSFTFGDSMAKMDKPERKPPFLKRELQGSIAEHGGVERFLEAVKKRYTYIEAQLWSDDYIL